MGTCSYAPGGWCDNPKCAEGKCVRALPRLTPVPNEQVAPEVLEYSETVYDDRGEPIGKMSTRCVRLSEYNWLRSENERLHAAMTGLLQSLESDVHGMIDARAAEARAVLAESPVEPRTPK